MFRFDYRDVSFAHKDAYTSSPKDEFTKHMHYFYEILYFIRGEAEFHVEDRVRVLAPDDIVLIKPGQFHFADINAALPYERYVFKLPGEALPKYLCQRLNQCGNFFSSSRDLLPLFERLDAAYEQFEEEEELRIAGISATWEILLHLSKRENDGDDKNEDPFLNTILNYVEEHISERLTLESLAQALNYSESYLASRFREGMKVSIISYIRGKKVMAAHALIQNGMKPNEAATAMGFTEYSTFYRDYRQLLGGSPSKTKSSR